MYKIVSSRGRAAYDINTYVCDTVEDMSRIIGRNMGDRCYVIHEYATYIVDGSGNWVKLKIYLSNNDSPTASSSIFGEGVMGDLIFGEG